MSSITQQNGDMKTKIGWLIAIIVPLLILGIPVTEIFTFEIKIFFVITMCAILIFAFELMDNMIPALLLPFLYYIFKLVPLATALQPWTSNIPWMCLGGFLMANILQRTGLLRRMAYWCIAKTGGTYKGIIWGIILFGIVFNFVKPGGSFVAMATFAYGICTALQLGKSKAAAGIMISAAFATLVPGYFVYVPTNAGLLLGIANAVTPISVSYFEYLQHNFIFIPFILILAWTLTKLFKPEQEINGKEYFVAELKKMGKMSTDEIKTAIVTVIVFICLISNKIDIGFVFVFFPCLLFFPGMNVGTKEDIAKVNFAFLVFVASCMSIGAVATALGVGKMISAIVLPYMEHLNNFGLVSLVWLLGVILNFILTPLAAMSAFGAPLAQIALDLNINPVPVMYAFYHALDQIVLPYEHAQYLMFFSFGLFSVKDFMKAFGIKMGLDIIYLLCIAVPYWMFIGLF